MLNGRRSEAPLWEIGVAYDRKSQQVGLIGTAPEKLSYQVVADYDSYQAIPRIAPPIKGVARLLQTPKKPIANSQNNYSLLVTHYSLRKKHLEGCFFLIFSSFPSYCEESSSCHS